jgi:hypothetical protein
MQVSAAAPGLGYIPYTASVTGSFQWQDIALVAKTNVANAFTVGGHSITSEGTAIVPLVLKGASGQTADNLQVQDSSANILGRINSSGQIGTSRLSVSPNASVSTVSRFFAAASSATDIVAVVRGAASQSANLQEWQNSAGTVLAFINSGGTLRAPIIQTSGSGADLREGTGGGGLTTMIKMAAAATNPGANAARLYFRDGTNAGTLKLVVRAGASGAETTILDNIPQT